MGKARTDSFTVEIPLRVSPSQEKRLLARLEAARHVYNACLGESLRRLALVRQSRAYQSAQRMPRGERRTQAFRAVDAALGFREYALHAYATQFNHSWLGKHLGIGVIQKLATLAFRAVRQYAFGKRGRPHFRRRNEMGVIEGKSNHDGIIWRDDRVKWLGLTLEAIVDPDDAVVAHGLACRVKLVRLVRRKMGGRNRFYAHLVCEGRPYQKAQNGVGHGVVGLDIGPSTIAVVGPNDALLERFCPELEPQWGKIRRLERKSDRQRRANNPRNYSPNGTAKVGARCWRKSGRQRRTEGKLAELQRRQAAHRKSQHGQLANRVLRMGNIVQTEKMSYRSLQRRFGRSVGMRAPGAFVARLKRKAAGVGAVVVEFPPHVTRLSQICHHCGAVKRKALSQRWHICMCGVVAQRDLYAAFLATCVESGHLNAGRAQLAWPGVDLLLQAALSRCEQLASGRPAPSSFGLQARRRQSQSPVEAGVNAAETQDAVPGYSSRSRESLGEAAESPEASGERPRGRVGASQDVSTAGQRSGGDGTHRAGDAMENR